MIIKNPLMFSFPGCTGNYADGWGHSHWACSYKATPSQSASEVQRSAASWQ